MNLFQNIKLFQKMTILEHIQDLLNHWVSKMSDVEAQKPMEDAPKTVVKSAVQFFFGTVLSRFSGFFREIALGAWFGATPTLAAFFVAYRFSQLLRRLFGESSLLSSFSPHFEQLRAQEPEKAKLFFRDLLASLATVLGGIILAVEAILFSWWKWGHTTSETEEILFLTAVMLPGVLFVCLYALFSALLQSDRKYFLPSIAPIFFNLIFLAILWYVKDWESESAVSALAIGVTFAFFIQWFFVALSTTSFFKEMPWKTVRLWTPELKKMVSAMGLTIIGIGAVQVNSFVDTLFARAADLSGPAYLYYAIRIYQLPLALFGIALSSALLPPLARARLAGDSQRFITLLQFALRKSLSLMIPITVALLTFGDSIVNLIYGRGAFDQGATLQTTTCLWGYGMGLVPAVAILILAPAFYAQKDFKTPLKASLFSVVINFGLNLLFIYGLGWSSSSIAVATSLAALMNAIYLFSSLTKQEGSLIDRPTVIVIGKIGICAMLAGFVTLLIGYFLIGGTTASLFMSDATLSFPRDLLSQILHLGIYGAVFVLSFFSYAWMLKIDEVFRMIGLKKG